MKLADYVERYHMAPLELEDFASEAVKLTPHGKKAWRLRRAGTAFLDAKWELLAALDDAGVEVG